MMRTTAAANSLLLRVILVGCVAAGAGAAILGIDLGSQWMKVALVKPGVPFQIVTNTASKRKTATMVGFGSENERIYAGDAENVAKRKPAHVFPMARSLVGRKVDHPAVRNVRNILIDQHEIFGNVDRNGAVYVKNVLGEEASDPAEAAEDEEGETTDDDLRLPTSFSSDELLGFVLGYAKTIGESMAEESNIKDCVITVPSYFTQSEREAVLDAAAVAKLNVLDLIDENVAAAVQFGVDRVFENKTHTVMYYNLGSTSLQVTVVEYSARQTKRFGKNVTSSVFRVLAKAWDEGVGGAYFDMRLANSLADHFNAMMRERLKDDTYDVRERSQRGWAKIKAQATKTKKVLSANDAIPVFIASVAEDRDLSGYKVSRRQLEEMSSDLFDRVIGPVDRALAQANLTAQDIDAVEIIGGGSRMPKVQQLLKERLGVEQLSVHLNGDEAMALGAAFRAANLSTSFRVRHVGASDINPFPVGVRLSGEVSEDLNGDDAVDLESASDEGDDDDNVWTKRTTLFKRGGPRASKKLVAFARDRDFACTLHYESDSETVPEGTPKIIREYKITGLDKIKDDETLKEFEGPKVNLAFYLDASGLVELTKAEAVFEETVEYEVEVEITDDEEQEGENETVETDVEETEESKKNDEAAEEGADEDEDKAGEADAEAKKKKKTKTVTRTKKRKHRRALKIWERTATADASVNESPVYGLRKSQSVGVLGGYNVAAVGALAKAHALVASMDAADTFRGNHARAANALESFVYAGRDFIRDEDNGAHEVTTESEREELMEMLEGAEDWLYEVDLKTPIADIDKRRAELEKRVDVVRERVAEVVGRPAAMKALREVLRTTEMHVEQWSTKREQIQTSEIEALTKKIASVRDWADEKQKAQSELLSTDDPAFKSSDVAFKARNLQRSLRKLLEKPKVRSVYLEAPQPKASQETEDVEAADKSQTSETDGASDSELNTEETAASDDTPLKDEL